MFLKIFGGKLNATDQTGIGFCVTLYSMHNHHKMNEEITTDNREKVNIFLQKDLDSITKKTRSIARNSQCTCLYK